MAEYTWCHGPNCHERRTTNRVRGVKGNKVLRTVKIRPNGWTKDSRWEYFCDQTCLMEFVNQNIKGMLTLAPRPEALETPINQPKRVQNEYGWVHTEITVDSTRTNDIG